MERRGERDKQVRELGYASPPAMIAAVTARRAAGDWRGVCAAGLVDAHVDLREVASRYGTEEAARIEADLRGFAPDLLRRFLPRRQSFALRPYARVLLSRRQTPFRQAGEARAAGVPVLVARLPSSEQDPQRLTLRVVDTGDLTGNWYDLPDWCWHADAVAARRWAYGASPTRLAWHSAEGDPYPPGTSIPSGPPADRAAQLETIAALLRAGQLVPAYRAAGLTVELADPPRLPSGAVGDLFTRYRVTLPVLASEVRRLVHRYGSVSFRLPESFLAVDVTADGGLTMRREQRDHGAYAFAVPAPVDVALLHRGALRPDDLHPLVHEALFPDRVQVRHVPGPAEWRPIRVRCGTDWHQVQLTGASISTPHHSAQDLDREFLLAQLGGPIAGCAAAVRAWRTGAKPVPKEIRKIRRQIFALALHGDTDGVLALLAHGLDPGLRDGQGRTLLFWLPHLDHTRVLPVLLAAGLSLTDRDREGGTPLHAAAAARTTDVLAALVAAGADPAAVDAAGRTPAEVFAQVERMVRTLVG